MNCLYIVSGYMLEFLSVARNVNFSGLFVKLDVKAEQKQTEEMCSLINKCTELATVFFLIIT